MCVLAVYSAGREHREQRVGYFTTDSYIALGTHALAAAAEPYAYVRAIGTWLSRAPRRHRTTTRVRPCCCPSCSLSAPIRLLPTMWLAFCASRLHTIPTLLDRPSVNVSARSNFRRLVIVASYLIHRPTTYNPFRKLSSFRILFAPKCHVNFYFTKTVALICVFE